MMAILVVWSKKMEIFGTLNLAYITLLPKRKVLNSLGILGSRWQQAPFPDPQWGFHPLGELSSQKMIPMGSLMVKK